VSDFISIPVRAIAMTEASYPVMICQDCRPVWPAKIIILCEVHQ
jgi:hypothetical protein